MLTACQPHDFPQYPANYREYAYVTNQGSATVTVLDVVNVRLDREMPVGQNPVAVAASPTRNEVYVLNAGAPGGQGSISVIDCEHNAVVATIPVGRDPARSMWTRRANWPMLRIADRIPFRWWTLRPGAPLGRSA